MTALPLSREETTMPRTKSKSDPRTRNGTATASAARASAKSGEVMTLAEAAAYLRVGEGDVLRLVREQALPGRKVGDDWRFLKAAIAGWLGMAPVLDAKQFWQTHSAALEDDPDLREIVREAYRRRGRPEDGEL
jgi:excisionase family DNA binding protein